MGAKKLQMSAQEIVTSYKTAADPKKQIRILAELNACTVGEIEAVLIQLGAMEKSDRKRPHPRAVQVDGDKARELLAQGLTDEETADALGVGLGKFRDWRRGEGIRPNREKKGVEQRRYRRVCAAGAERGQPGCCCSGSGGGTNRSGAGLPLHDGGAAPRHSDRRHGVRSGKCGDHRQGTAVFHHGAADQLFHRRRGGIRRRAGGGSGGVSTYGMEAGSSIP